MKRFYLFNPEHDLALANGDRHFIAPANIRVMAHDLALLIREVHGPGGGRPFPWGWDSMVVERFKKMGVPIASLPSASALGSLRRRSGRQTSHHLLAAFRTEHPCNHYIGESILARDIDEIALYAAQHGHILLKNPLSSSGKGLRHVNLNDNVNVNENRYPDSLSSLASSSPLKKVESWANALIHRHGYLTAEPYYNKEQDFAMEFLASGNKCLFVGYSLFATDHHGRYVGSYLMSDERIEEQLASYVSREALHELRDWIITHRSLIIPDEWDTHRFPLYFGIDMMVVKTTDNRQLPEGHSDFKIHNSEFKIHPCVEINLRMNMGIIAHEIYCHRLAPDAEGMYRIARFADNATLRAFHEEQSMKHPSIYCNGKLVSGYAAITPIADETLHIAYIIIGEEGTKTR